MPLFSGRKACFSELLYWVKAGITSNCFPHKMQTLCKNTFNPHETRLNIRKFRKLKKTRKTGNLKFFEFSDVLSKQILHG